MAKILVVGGAGYVGSAAAAWLLDQGHEVHILDDLSRGRRELVLSELTIARAGDSAVVGKLFRKFRPDCVMHFAAFAYVDESVREPRMYQENNVDQTRTLLETMLECGIRRFVFSSTCAIFGDVGNQRIHEDLEKKPVNPYGQTKLDVEKMLEEFASRGMQSISLRYFNACGTEPKLRVGEMHEPETHLIPRVLESIERGEPARIFGTDYPTPDGTCIRDYIHVTDLARGHEAAMKRLLERKEGCFEVFNLGSGDGYSVREIITAIEKVLGRKVTVREEARRPGDPPRLVADSSKARRELGFRIDFPLPRIIETAWQWREKRR